MKSIVNALISKYLFQVILYFIFLLIVFKKLTYTHIIFKDMESALIFNN